MLAEAELIRRCRQGEAEAWNDLFDRHYGATGRFVFQLSPGLTPEDTEEICQEVFLSVVRNLASFNGKSQLQTWIFRVAVNKTRDYIEKQRAAKRGGGKTTLSLQAENEETGLTLDPPSPAAGPDLTLINQENATRVAQALQRLSDPCREIIELRYFGDLSYEEISQELDLNQKTVSSRLSKCLDKLGELARGEFSEEHFPETSV